MQIDYDADGYFRRLPSGPYYFAGVREDWYYHRDGRATHGLTYDLCARDPNGVTHVIEAAVERFDGGPDYDYDTIWDRLVDSAIRAGEQLRRENPMNF